MELRAKGTMIVAGLLTVIILSGLGLYENGPAPETGKGSCYCENWKKCGFDDPNDCICCEGGCKPPKGGPSCRRR